MAVRIAALLLSIATSAFSEKPPGQCSSRQDLRLLQKLSCTITVKEGHLNALCNIAIVGSANQDRRNGYFVQMNVLLINLKLVSDKPVLNMTLKDEPACLSLTKISANQLDNYNGYFVNYTMVGKRPLYLGPFESKDFFNEFRLMTFNTTFNKPPQVAAAVCREIRPDGSCLFTVYGFLQNGFNFSAFNSTEAFIQQWNIDFSFTDTLNITVEEGANINYNKLYTFLSEVPVKRFLCYRCDYWAFKALPLFRNRHTECISFFQSAIIAFPLLEFPFLPNLKHISLEGTGLSGIPEAIFNVPRLDTLDMSDTDNPTSVLFDYTPPDWYRNSSATRLILSGSKLTTLPNRAFCAFPILEELALDSCHLRNISGSPFECLKCLKALSMSGNNIESLDEENVRGLQSLVTLDISNNGIAYFQGTYILPTLVSLRSLSLAHNSLGKLDLRSQGKVMIEELNIEWNNVELWEPPLFSGMVELKKLSLAHNRITQLDYKMVHDIQHVHDLDFSSNPWDCYTCNLNNLHSLLRKRPPKCRDCFSCTTPLELYKYDVRNVTWREDDCGPLDYYRMYAVPGLISFMLATLLANIAYRKRWYIMYALLYLKVTIKGYRRQRNGGNFLFDGFLSYHASDADWVRDVLLQKLESPPMQFRLCVAERDFIPGMEITENICRAIAQSRTSLFVISREFYRSRWCMFELSLAQHRLFESDRQDGMVFIKKDDVDESELSTLLQYLIKSRTYIQIPPDGSSETLNNLFWLQVQAALEK